MAVLPLTSLSFEGDTVNLPEVPHELLAEDPPLAAWLAKEDDKKLVEGSEEAQKAEEARAAAEFAAFIKAATFS